MLLLSVLVRLLAAASLAAPAPLRAADDLFTQIYNRSLLKKQSMQSIRARFTETTVSSLLVRPIVARGTVIAAAPARVLMTYTEPEPKVLAMDGRSLVVAWPRRQERERIDITQIQKRVDQYFTHASVDELRSMFDVAATADPAVRNADRIDMRPKRKQIKEGLERLELWIDRESVLLVQMRMTFPGGDQKTITLDDIATNIPVSDETFRIPQ